MRIGRAARTLLGLDKERAPGVTPPTKLERYLIALIALAYVFVMWSSVHGWRALIQVERLKESCDAGGSCWRTIYLGAFDTPLRVSATTGVRVGDFMELGLTCTGAECEMKVLAVKPSQVEIKPTEGELPARP